jgi:hypothetical protein
LLGDKVGEEKGRVTSRRILPSGDPRYVKMEVSFEAEGKLLGVEMMNIGTYTVFERIPGQLYGEGQGVAMTRDGEGLIWNGHGVGQPTPDGLGMKFAASIAFQTDSQKLARLNGCLVLIEHEAAGDGTIKSTLYEWKA